MAKSKFVLETPEDGFKMEFCKHDDDLLAINTVSNVDSKESTISIFLNKGQVSDLADFLKAQSSRMYQ